MKTIIIATGNKGKVKEFKEILEPLGFVVKSLGDFTNLPNIIEDKDTFDGNAIKKAMTIGSFLDMDVIADDSGICVEYLNGNPGVFSARYAGVDATDHDNNEKLMKKMHGVTNRKAKFNCSIALYCKGKCNIFTGEISGHIDTKLNDGDGFGYDPLFIYDGTPFSKMDSGVKNEISHRGIAIRKLVDYMKLRNV